MIPLPARRRILTLVVPWFFMCCAARVVSLTEINDRLPAGLFTQYLLDLLHDDATRSHFLQLNQLIKHGYLEHGGVLTNDCEARLVKFQDGQGLVDGRSEERSVGKEWVSTCRSRGEP